MKFSYAHQYEMLNQNFSELRGKINVSFEFFPPNNEFMQKLLWNSINSLKILKPKFVSVTHCSKLPQSNNTYNVIKHIKQHTDLEAAPHMTCVDNSTAQLSDIAKNYWNIGIRHIVALRGDLLPNNQNKPVIYAYHLVKLLKKIADFKISVAAYPEMHPEANNVAEDLINLKRKIDEGAHQAITQFFFDIESYLRFRDRCVALGINIEIIPGILPIFNFKQVKKFAHATNVHIPKWMNVIFSGVDNIEIAQMIGANIAINMVKLLCYEGIRNFHFYTMNRCEMSSAICHSIGIKAINN